MSKLNFIKGKFLDMYDRQLHFQWSLIVLVMLQFTLNLIQFIYIFLIENFSHFDNLQFLIILYIPPNYFLYWEQYYIALNTGHVNIPYLPVYCALNTGKKYWHDLLFV